MPVVPGMLLATGLVVFGRDLGTALVLFAILLGMLWVVGAPARFFALCLRSWASSPSLLAPTSGERHGPDHHLHRPVPRLPQHRLAARPRSLRPVERRLFGAGHRGQPAEVGDLPEAHTDFIFAVLGEELGLIGTLLVIGLFLTIAYAAMRVALRTADAFTRYMTFGDHRLAARAT